MKSFVTANVIPYRPFAWKNEITGKLEGFDVDIIKAIGKEIGISVNVQATTWEKIFFNLLEKQCDLVIAALTVTKQRLETIIFSDSYLTAGQIITVPKNSTIKDLNDLEQKNVGVLKNTTGDFIMKDMKDLHPLKIRKYPSKTKAFTSLQNGETDALVIDRPLALYFIKNHPDLEFTIACNMFTTENYAIAFRKESLQLRENINLGLKKIKENGIYQEILDKFF